MWRPTGSCYRGPLQEQKPASVVPAELGAPLPAELKEPLPWEPVAQAPATTEPPVQQELPIEHDNPQKPDLLVQTPPSLVPADRMATDPWQPAPKGLPAAATPAQDSPAEF